MLTRNDLNQIREVIQEEVRSIVHEEVKEEVRAAIHEEVRIIVREEVKEEVSLQLKPVNRKLSKIQKEINFIVKDYTNAVVHVRNRVEKIETCIGLAQ